jgi:hypothetical protein
MTEFKRLSSHSGWVDLEFGERERTPHQVIEAGILLQLPRVSLLNLKQFLKRWVSSEAAPSFTIGYKKATYSQPLRRSGITPRLTKP